MRIPAYIRRSRHGIFYFRVVIPIALRSRWSGRPEIKMSLKTRDQRQALIRARDLAIEAHKSFEYAYGDMSAKPFDPNDKSTWPTAKDNIHKFEKTIETVHPSGYVDRVHYKVDPNSPADIAAAAADQAKHYLRQRMMREPNSLEAQAFFLAEDEQIRRELDDSVRLREAALAVEHARLQAVTLAAGTVPTIQGTAIASAPASPAPIETRQHRVATPADGPDRQARNISADADYHKHKLTTLWLRFLKTKTKGGITAKAEGTYQMKFDAFIQWYGDTHIEDVTPSDISEYKDHLLHDVTVRAGKTRGQVGLDTVTVDNYVGVINGLYKWAQKNGAFPRQMLIPTTDQRITTKAVKKARALSGKANRAFKIDELIQAFEPKAYRSENRQSHHFWPPLIALYTGMRLGEVSQLACTDIRMEDGIWAFDINDEEYKKVKSAAARRVIPMHPELIALGLPEFMRDVKALNLGAQLFPVLLPKDDGSQGNAPGKKWDLYLKVVELTDDALTYHSFRRTANTLLKKARVPFDVRCQMVGHDLDHVNESYASEYSVADLAEMVLPKFVFPGLDLSGLRYESGQYDEAIKTGYEKALADARRRKQEKIDVAQRAADGQSPDQNVSTPA